MDGIGVEEILRLKGLNPSSHGSAESSSWMGSIMYVVVFVVRGRRPVGVMQETDR